MDLKQANIEYVGSPSTGRGLLTDPGVALNTLEMDVPSFFRHREPVASKCEVHVHLSPRSAHIIVVNFFGDGLEIVLFREIEAGNK